ncbi:MAG TPA: RNA polymerase sigma factor [Devosia sp.]|jgi:RNA polymerase sigma factor (sigma-70 family)|nr:RNA polymerase sigma factor [Devosia sp.]
MSDAAAINRAIEAVVRNERPRLVAGLMRMTRDLALAEELAQDALVVALNAWPRSGIPGNPAAWLTQTAKRRAIDYFRHKKMAAAKLEEIGRSIDDGAQDHIEQLHESLDDDVGDDLLRLIFTSCHPVLPAESRVALTLRLLGGLTTEEIARAFLTAEPTIGQRIVRAKRTIAEAAVPFEVPRGADRQERLASVLGVVYLIFNEGYSSSTGDDWIRPQLCDTAIQLGRVLTRLMPAEPEAHSLLALMLLQYSRAAARTDTQGEPVLLSDQDRSLWDKGRIEEGLAALERATALGGADQPYALQAAIGACHARASKHEDTNWRKIAELYGRLAARAPSPVVELNRAVAVSMAQGPAAGLALVDRIKDDPALQKYHLLFGIRGDLLSRLGRHTEAMLEFRRAADLTRNDRERRYLLGRAAVAS